MTKGIRKHPPKKKHSNRPRPEPVTPLTELQRWSSAIQEFAKAEMHLQEAEAIAKAGIAPNAYAHSAYYSMHHCAAAAILASGGVGKRKSSPGSHTHVIEHFGLLVEGESGTLGETGRMLSRAQTDREVADYGLVSGMTQRSAAELTDSARTFLEACNNKWNFRQPPFKSTD